ASRPRHLLLSGHHRDLVRTGVPARGAGRADVPSTRVHEDVRDDGGVHSVDHLGARADDHLHPWQAVEARVSQSNLAFVHLDLRPNHPPGPRLEMDRAGPELRGRAIDDPIAVHDWQRVHAAALRGITALHANIATRPLDYRSDEAAAGTGQDAAEVSGSRHRIWHRWPGHNLNRKHTDGHGEYHRDAEAQGSVEGRPDIREAAGRHGCGAAVSGIPERLDTTDQEPAGHAPDWHQDTRGHQ